MKTYFLKNTKGDNFSSGAPVVVCTDDGEEVLFSYCTEIMKKTKSGEYMRKWSGWSMTTGKHIAAFCGLNKAGFCALPFYK